MNRRLLKLVVLFALLQYAVQLSLGGIIFLLSHVPPKAVNLDGLVLALVRVEDLLVTPRRLLLRLWPGETTPGGLGLCLTILNSLVWGCSLAGLRLLWRKLTT